MARNATQALTWLAKLEASGTTQYDGLCKTLAHDAYNVDSNGTSDAIESWESNTHRGDGDPKKSPKGALIFWTTGPDGHVGLHDGDGNLVANHWGDDEGRIRTIPIDEISRQLGDDPDGWSYEIDGHVVIKPKDTTPDDHSHTPPHTTAPKPKPATTEKLAAYVKPGGKGPQVETLQQALLDAGYGPIPHAITDHYGPETKKAVARFHDANPDLRTGPAGKDRKIGPKGWAELQRQAAAARAK